MTKVNREVEELHKVLVEYCQSFSEGYVVESGVDFTKFDKAIKNFRSQTRNDLLREIMEEMPRKKPSRDPIINTYSDDYQRAFNKAIDQVNTLLERKLSTVKGKCLN